MTENWSFTCECDTPRRQNDEDYCVRRSWVKEGERGGVYVDTKTSHCDPRPIRAAVTSSRELPTSELSPVRLACAVPWNDSRRAPSRDSTADGGVSASQSSVLVAILCAICVRSARREWPAHRGSRRVASELQRCPSRLPQTSVLALCACLLLLVAHAPALLASALFSLPTNKTEPLPAPSTHPFTTHTPITSSILPRSIATPALPV